MNSQAYKRSREKEENLIHLRERVMEAETSNKKDRGDIENLRIYQQAQQARFSKKMEQIRESHSMKMKNLQIVQKKRFLLEQEKLPEEWEEVQEHYHNSKLDRSDGFLVLRDDNGSDDFAEILKRTR